MFFYVFYAFFTNGNENIGESQHGEMKRCVFQIDFRCQTFARLLLFGNKAGTEMWSDEISDFLPLHWILFASIAFLAVSAQIPSFLDNPKVGSWNAIIGGIELGWKPWKRYSPTHMHLRQPKMHNQYTIIHLAALTRVSHPVATWSKLYPMHLPSVTFA